MSAEGSVALWIEELKAGSKEAARQLWERYFARLVDYARKEMARRPRGASDEEDIALSAILHFYLRAADQQFPDLKDRKDLERILIGIVAWKVRDAARHSFRGKRDLRRLRNDASHDGWESDRRQEGAIEQVPDRHKLPDEQLLLAEEVERLLQLLGEPGTLLRQVAEWRMEGWTNEEIANKLDCSLATVERKLKRIRELWCTERG